MRVFFFTTLTHRKGNLSVVLLFSGGKENGQNRCLLSAKGKRGWVDTKKGEEENTRPLRICCSSACFTGGGRKKERKTKKEKGKKEVKQVPPNILPSKRKKGKGKGEGEGTAQRKRGSFLTYHSRDPGSGGRGGRVFAEGGDKV